MESGNQLAKTAILSSLVSLTVVFGVLYVVRFELVALIESEKPASASFESSATVLTNDQQIIASIKKVNDAVVSVVVTKDVPVYERYYESVDPYGFFGGFAVPRVRENGTEEREVGGGSGFIVSSDGMIVTNRHVVDDVDARYSILLNDGSSYPVTVLARDTQLDIAILQIDEPLRQSLTHVNFGDSQTIQLGETAIAIGNALAEFRNSVSVGVVSGVSRSITASDSFGRSEQLNQVIQTDAAINPGNSGGPLLNIRGEVIGVNVATSRGADNIGFALPANVVKQVVDSVREYGEIVRPYLGVRYSMIDEQSAQANGLPVTYGALISSGTDLEGIAVMPDSPADKAGITDGTIILAVDGEDLVSKDLSTVLRGKAVGQVVELSILESGVQREVSITLEKAL